MNKSGFKRKRAASTGRTYAKRTYKPKKMSYSKPASRGAPRRSLTTYAAGMRKGAKFSQPASRFTTANADGEAVASALRGEYSGLSEYSQDLILSILDPEMCMNPQRWPNTYGTSALFKTKNVMEANFTAAADAGDNLSLDNTARSLIVVYPQMKSCIFTTQASQKLTNFALNRVDLHSGDADNKTPMIETTVSLGAAEQISISQPMMFPGGKALFPFPNKSTQKLLYAIKRSSGAGGGANTGIVLCFKTNAPPGRLGLSHRI